MQTAVTDFLDEHHVPYELKPHGVPALTAATAAQERGVRASQVVKCMVGETESGQLVAMLIPGDRRLKSSRARKHLGASSLELVPPQRLIDEHGLVVGAISPTQLIGRAVILADPAIFEEDRITISSGDPMAGVELAAEDLVNIVRADRVDIIAHSR